MDTSSHIRKAERNEQFYNSNNFNSSSFNEWGTVILFYSAMHYVDALLAQQSGLPPQRQHPTNHQIRNSVVANSLTLGCIYKDYKSLHDRSRDARYSDISFPYTVLNSLKTAHFEPIKSHVRTSLNLP